MKKSNLLLVSAFALCMLFTGCEKTSTVTDIDGNVYKTVFIEGQEWMAENLKTTKYDNGDPIAEVTDNTQWSSLTTGAWSYYNNDENIQRSVMASYTTGTQQMIPAMYALQAGTCPAMRNGRF